MNANEQRALANQKKMQQELDEAMRATMYPEGLVMAAFRVNISLALLHESQQSLDCDWTMLRKLIVKSGTSYTMAEMAYALNCLQNKTAHQLGASLSEYVEIMDAQHEMATKWNEIMTPIRESIAKKYLNQKPLYIPHRGIKA